jgi:hypothetical protein
MSIPGEAELMDAFDTFERSVFRLEQRSLYNIPGERDRVLAFLDGRPEPPRDDGWAREITASVASGKDWCRVHIVDELTGYMRWKLHASKDTADAGYRTYVVDRDVNPALSALTTDFYVFDDERVFVLAYARDGQPVAALNRTDYLPAYQLERDIALRLAVPLDAYVASHRQLLAV